MSIVGSADEACFQTEPDAKTAASRCTSFNDIREYLIRSKTHHFAEGDEKLGEHIVGCESCAEMVEEIQSLEDVLQWDYNKIAPILTAVVHTPEQPQLAIEAPAEIVALQDDLVNRIASEIERARTIDRLDREYEEAFRSEESRARFQASCKAAFRAVDPDRMSACRESMIGLITEQSRAGTKQRLNDIPAAKEYPVEFLLGYSSSKSIVDSRTRIWYRVPNAVDPLDIVIDTERLALSATV